MLPFDLLVSTLNQLPVSRHDESSVQTLVSCLAVSSHFRAVASLSHLWEPHYRARYRHCIADKERQRFELHKGNYYLMYRERRELDNRAIDILNSVIFSRTERQSKACALPDLSYDVWDALEAEKHQPIPVVLHPNYEEEDSEDDPRIRPHAITRIFWAKMCQGVISKRHAISLWSKVHSQRHEAMPPSRPSLEEAFAGLSEFFGYSYLDLEDHINYLRMRCKEYIDMKGIATDPMANEFNLDIICVNVCKFMRDEGLGPAYGKSTFPICVKSFKY
jgi:F-box protein 21